MSSDKIIKFIKESTKSEDIAEDTPLLETNILDSLQLIQLIMFLEKEFNVSIKQDDLIPDNFQTVNKIKMLIEKSRNVSELLER